MTPEKVYDVWVSHSGLGFFGIHGGTEVGREWIDANVQGAEYGMAQCDDRRLVEAILDAAADDDLEVDA